MQTEGPPLTLDRFIVEMGREPAATIAAERFLRLALALDLDDAIVRAHVRFCDGHYARNLICRTPRFELLVLCWKPGQASTIHDHAGSLNVTSVYEGALTSRLFAREGGGGGVAEVGGAQAALPSGPVHLVRQDVLAGAGHAAVDRGEIHQLANESDAGLVTVHLYAPPLTDVLVYSTIDAATKVTRLRYSLADDFA